jgi:hypothetical protein
MDWGSKARMVKYSQELNNIEKVMDWDKKVEMVQLGNKARNSDDKTEFNKFVLDNIHDFDVQAFDMFLNLIELIPTEMTKNIEFYKEIYSVLWSIDTNRMSFRADMRRHLLLTICEEEFNMQH